MGNVHLYTLDLLRNRAVVWYGNQIVSLPLDSLTLTPLKPAPCGQCAELVRRWLAPHRPFQPAA